MTTEGFKRMLTAILSAHVEGYSRLMSQNRKGTAFHKKSRKRKKRKKDMIRHF